MLADPHPLQAARLRELRSYEILDTPREGDFDEVVSLAARICETPIALVSLVDEDRQWFKAAVGLDVPETGLDASVCSHAILRDGLTEIADTTADPRTADNPLCVALPGGGAMRFYAGAPLVTPEGLPLGTLCVLDREPRTLTDLQRETLRVLAQQVMAQLEMRRALRRADTLRREVEHRVKNSLQFIDSFTRLQARGAQTEEARAVLKEVSGRIAVVSLLHEILYEDEAGDAAPLTDYLARLTSQMARIAPDNVRIDYQAGADMDRLRVGNKVARACGILVNEFVTNSFKYAFPDGRPGTVTVSLAPLGEGGVRLECRDDGVGTGAPLAEVKPGLGLRIMQSTAAQVGGAFGMASDGTGTRAWLEFGA